MITSLATRLLGVGTACLVATACTSAVAHNESASPRPATTSTPPGPSPLHTARPPVVVILMENEESSSVVRDATNAPYINNTLIPSGTLFTNYYAVSHPSLPNYLALTVGNTCGKDGTDTVTPLCTEPSIWTQMNAARITAREWAENESANCSYAADGTGRYAERHDSYAIVANAEALSTCGDLTSGTDSSSPGLARLDDALASASPPAYSFVTPNLCDDMHDCPVSSGDSWLSANVSGLLRAGADVIVTFDEGTSDTNGGGHVMTVEAGPGVPVGVHDGTFFSHYSLLAGIEKHFGLPLLSNARTATPLPIGGLASPASSPLPSLTGSCGASSWSLIQLTLKMTVSADPHRQVPPSRTVALSLPSCSTALVYSSMMRRSVASRSVKSVAISWWCWRRKASIGPAAAAAPAPAASPVG